MPQLDIFTFISQIFWLLSSLSLIFLFINYFFLPLVYSSLKVRLIKNINLYKNLNFLRKNQGELINFYNNLINKYLKNSNIITKHINITTQTYFSKTLKHINKPKMYSFSKVFSRFVVKTKKNKQKN